MAVVVTPARRVRQSPASTHGRTVVRALGPENRNPCVGCVRSATGGRSNGECHKNVLGGDRCWRCASGPDVFLFLRMLVESVVSF